MADRPPRTTSSRTRGGSVRLPLELDISRPDRQANIPGEKYSLYRKLSKEQSSASITSRPTSQTLLPASHVPPPSSGPAHASSSAGPSRTQTPRTIPNNEYPTTPTPRSRRSSSSGSRPVPSGNVIGRRIFDTTEDSRPSSLPTKRSAPSPTKSPSSSRLFTTPKKARPSYSGPIHDPNPINPFSSPARSSTSRSLFVPQPPSSHAKPTEPSPFLHASSPRKLKELLEANSLRKMKERAAGQEEDDTITPRTKARRRLAGDFITPVKDKGPRKKRGEAKTDSGTHQLATGDNDKRLNGKDAMRFEDAGTDDEEEEEEEFGPSPMKPGLNRRFTELLQAADELPIDRDRSNRTNNLLSTAPKRSKKGKEDKVKSASITSFFARPIKGKVTVQLEQPSPEPVTVTEAHPTTSFEEENDILQRVMDAGQVDETRAGEEAQGTDRLSTPPPAPDTENTAREPEPALMPSARRLKVVELSEDEIDDFDPEGGHIRRKVVITGTRRNVKRRGSLSSLSDQHPVPEDEMPSENEEAAAEDETSEGNTDLPGGSQGGVEFVDDEDDEDTAPPLTAGESAPTETHSSPRSTSLAPPAPLPLLSLLSLKSPPRSTAAKINNLRVKAIFNPFDAARLKAARKGQDIYTSGEGTAPEEDEVLDKYGLTGGDPEEEEVEGDDDWEEECEGWKRTPLGMDDEDW